MNKKQDFAFSCGAASLLCAAAELGVTTMPNTGARSTGQALQANYFCEAALYQITSGSVTGGRLDKEQADLSKLGYSFPHNVAIAARELGLDVKIYMSGMIASALSTFYPDAETKCVRAGFPIIHSEPPALAANRRALKIVMTFGIGLHYVMQRPDGTYMDPGDGKDFADFKQMNLWNKCYNATGITLVLERLVSTAAA
ncbi:hypothetical protein AB688_18895 [Pseudomonas putida]|uniref:hypothetical protein n=1 Tax=Pseudomonas putida TaxID=303 RepID=UPI0007B6B81B|nr:hypothetical protein [Pseudomonas putida]ANC04061.1 hypothetical protein AB688_18895 [Pseudomonas putida]